MGKHEPDSVGVLEFLKANHVGVDSYELLGEPVTPSVELSLRERLTRPVVTEGSVWGHARNRR